MLEVVLGKLLIRVPRLGKLRKRLFRAFTLALAILLFLTLARLFLTLALFLLAVAVLFCLTLALFLLVVAVLLFLLVVAILLLLLVVAVRFLLTPALLDLARLEI